MEQYFFKRLIFIGAALFLGACSAQKGDSTPEVTQLEQLQSAGGLISTPDTATGTSTGSDVTLTLTLKTNSSTLRTETITLTPESQGFSLLTTSCPNINNTRTCTVRIKFTAAGKANGTYTGAVVVSDLTVPLSLVLNKPMANDLSGLKVGLDAVEDISALDFGTISATGSVTKVLIVKDINKSIKENITITSSSADFTVLTTSCVTTALNSTAGCSVRLQFNGTGKTPGNFAGNLNISTRVIPMTGVLQAAPIFVGTPDVKMLINDVVISQQNFGTINLNEKKAVVIKIKNEGTAASISNYFSVSGSSAFYVTGSSCGSTIQAGGSCQFTLNFNGVNLLSNQTATINYGSTNIQALGEILGNCPVSQHLEGTACVNNIQNETVSNGSRVRSYNVGSSSWGDWAYNCSPTYIPSPSTNSCIPEFIKPNAPIVTLEMSSDQNHLIATSTCRADLYGVFMDLFYEPDNLLPADQYQYPLFVDQTYLHEDLGVRPESICIPTGINNMGLMTVSVEISNEMREETVTLHSMIKGALMWDNNRNSDFSEPVSLFVGCPNGEHKENGLCISNLQNEIIANGSRERSFDMDSRQWLAWSYTCDPDYTEHLDACILDSYTAQFGTIVNNKTEPCTGTETVSAPLVTCTRDLDGTLDSSLMKCANQTPPSEDHVSPEQLRKPISIPNGTRYESCVAGGQTWTLDEILCVNSDYAVSGENCVLDTYTAQFAPLVNTKTEVCSGTETVTQQMSSCVRDLDGVTLDPSMAKCSGQVGQSATYASDYGTRTTTQNINGTLVEECAVGAQVWTLKTLDCNSGYVKTGSVCVPFTASIASFNPVAPQVPLTGAALNITPTASTITMNNTALISAAPASTGTRSNQIATLSVNNQASTNVSVANSGVLSTASTINTYVNANAGLTSCTPSSITISNCSSGSFSFTGANLLALSQTGSPTLNVTLNNSYVLNVPYSRYTLTQVSNMLSSGSDSFGSFLIKGSYLYFKGSMSGVTYQGNTEIFRLGTNNVITKLSYSTTAPPLDATSANMIAINNELYFGARYDNTGGRPQAVYKVNATDTAVQRVSSASWGTFNEYAVNIFGSGAKLGSDTIFRDAYSRIYYKMTPAGALTAIYTGPGSETSNKLLDPVEFNNRVYFVGISDYNSMNFSQPNKLYSVDTSFTVRQQVDITGSVTTTDNLSTFSGNTKMLVFNNKLFFVANNKLYSLDTANNLVRYDFVPGVTESPNYLTVTADAMYFMATINASGHYKLFKMDLSGNISQISNITNNASDNIQYMVAYKGDIFFGGPSSYLYRYSPKYNVINTMTTSLTSITDFIVFNDELYFMARNASSNSKLFKIKKEDF